MIPIYRAKKIDSDEWVEGYLWSNYDKDSYWIIQRCDLTRENTHQRIDPNTLAIHFPNMIDKNGKKIFASLSEDGVGGDNIRGYAENEPIVFDDIGTARWEDLEVTGIHKGEQNASNQ